LYHVDLTFCPLDDRRALCAPSGWDEYGRRVVAALVPEPLWLEDDEALSFCANSVVVGANVVTSVGTGHPPNRRVATRPGGQPHVGVPVLPAGDSASTGARRALRP